MQGTIILLWHFTRINLRYGNAVKLVLKKIRTMVGLVTCPNELWRVLLEKSHQSVLCRTYQSILRAPAAVAHFNQQSEYFYYSIRTRINYRYRRVFGRNPNLKNPLLYSEKVQWRKYYCPDVKRLGTLADKAGVYDFVRPVVGDSHLAPILWSGNQISESDVISLGNQIVYKTTHRSGQVIFINDIAEVNVQIIVSMLNEAMKWPYSMVGQEPWYDAVAPAIIAQPMLFSPDGSYYLDDVKFHIFRQVDKSQIVVTEVINLNGHWRATFDEQFNRLPFDWGVNDYPPPEYNPEKHPCFDVMMNNAKELAGDLDYVRIDFMTTSDSYYFTEFTFAPGGGMQVMDPIEWDLILGGYWQLDTGTRIKRAGWFLHAWIRSWRTERPVRLFNRLYRKRKRWAKYFWNSQYEISHNQGDTDN